MKKFISLFLTLCLTSFCFAYEQGKIDTHGGKGDSLLNSKGFSKEIGLFADKPNKEEEQNKEQKNFIEIEQIQKIEKKGVKKQ